MSCRNRTVALASLCLSSLAAFSSGQTTTQIVQGADGITWQETAQYHRATRAHYGVPNAPGAGLYAANRYDDAILPAELPYTLLRNIVGCRVGEGVLNPFVQPYWAHELQPFTRWENRPATVQVPVTTTNWVAATRTVSQPVVTYKPVKEETVSRVALSVAPSTTPASQSATALASRPQLSPIGGQQMTSDPPRTASGWTSASGSGNRYR